jgi:hypothetical protein
MEKARHKKAKDNNQGRKQAVGHQQNGARGGKDISEARAVILEATGLGEKPLQRP